MPFSRPEPGSLWLRTCILVPSISVPLFIFEVLHFLQILHFEFLNYNKNLGQSDADLETSVKQPSSLNETSKRQFTTIGYFGNVD